jgi:hypothetical protein
MMRATNGITANSLLQAVIAEYNTASYLNGLHFFTFNVTVYTIQQLLQKV